MALWQEVSGGNQKNVKVDADQKKTTEDKNFRDFSKWFSVRFKKDVDATITALASREKNQLIENRWELRKENAGYALGVSLKPHADDIPTKERHLTLVTVPLDAGFNKENFAKFERDIKEQLIAAQSVLNSVTLSSAQFSNSPLLQLDGHSTHVIRGSSLLRLAIEDIQYREKRALPPNGEALFFVDRNKHLAMKLVARDDKELRTTSLPSSSAKDGESAVYLLALYNACCSERIQ